MSVPSQDSKSIVLIAPLPLKESHAQKIANSERQSLLILKITTSVTFCAGAIVLYIGVLAMAKSPFKASMPHVYSTNNDSTKVIS